MESQSPLIFRFYLFLFSYKFNEENLFNFCVVKDLFIRQKSTVR